MTISANLCKALVGVKLSKKDRSNALVGKCQGCGRPTLIFKPMKFCACCYTKLYRAICERQGQSKKRKR